MQYYFQRCFPTIDHIVDRVRQVLADRKKRKNELKSIYIMTNGDITWLNDLKKALMEIKKWDSVTNSRDLRLDWEAKPVAQAMDMLVGQRADVFIGNGVSHSFSVVVSRVQPRLPPRVPVLESDFQYRHVPNVTGGTARRYQILVVLLWVLYWCHPVVRALASGITHPVQVIIPGVVSQIN